MLIIVIPSMPLDIPERRALLILYLQYTDAYGTII